MGKRRRLVGVLGRRQRFRLLREVSRDALGSVWEAEDSWMPVLRVMVRELRGDLSRNPAIADLIRRHLMDISSRLSHPAVARFLNVLEADVGPRFIVMEWVEGETVAELVSRRYRFSVKEVAAVGSQVASALAAAHEIDIAHGALSERNIVVSPLGHVKVTDFGLAVAVERAFEAAPPGDVEAADPEGDLSALGRVLTTMLSTRERVPGRGSRAEIPGAALDHIRAPSSAGTTADAGIPEADPEERPVAANLASRLDAAWNAARSEGPTQTLQTAETESGRKDPIVDLSGQEPVIDLDEPGPGGSGPEIEARLRAVTRGGLPATGGGSPRSETPREVRTDRRRWIGGALVTAVALAVALVAISREGQPGTSEPRTTPTIPALTNTSPTNPRPILSVPDVTGLAALDALEMLNDAGLHLARVEPVKGAPGVVKRTEPAAGAKVSPGAGIVLYVGVLPDRVPGR
jgi:eukaryotic-like serine/threonine-protein kinase